MVQWFGWEGELGFLRASGHEIIGAKVLARNEEGKAGFEIIPYARPRKLAAFQTGSRHTGWPNTI